MPFDLVLYIFFFLLISVIVYPLHELGHLVAGLICGWQFKFFSVFCLVFYFNNGLKIKPMPKPERMKCFFGMVMLIPKTEEQLKGSALYAAGGTIVTLLLSVALLFLGLIFSYHPLWFFYPLAPLPLTILSLLPIQNGLLRSDGLRLLRLLRGGKEAAEEQLLLKLTTIKYKMADHQFVFTKADEQVARAATDTALRYVYYCWKLDDNAVFSDEKEAIKSDLDALLASNVALKEYDKASHAEWDMRAWLDK
ncbi:MAG: hypothetical protein LBG97_08410 [Coriobacteriales bacterium]|jgi:hypothetical protein|nr:hypothetical protein [Coriobacteriales bacterium]